MTKDTRQRLMALDDKLGVKWIRTITQVTSATSLHVGEELTI